MSEIRDFNFEWNTGIGDFTKQESGNDTFFFWESRLKM